jgi:hypothetical protein
VGRSHLQLKDLMPNDLEVVRDLRFAFAPFLEISGKIVSF